MTLVGYHASTRRIDTVVQFRDPRGMDYGPGFYLATDPRDTTSYGSWVHRAEVRLDRPILFSTTSVDAALVKKLQRAFHIEDEDMFGSGPPLVEIMKLVNVMIGVGSYTSAQVLKFLMKLGYDGLYIERDVLALASKDFGLAPPHGDYFAIFQPEQILSWEPLATNYQAEAYKAVRSNPASSPVGTASFKRWFGDSKIVDSQGQPRVMYHGTGARPFDDFIDWRPMFFTSDKAYADAYTSKTTHGQGRPRVIKVHLSIAKPFDTRIEAHRRVYNEAFVPWATSKFTARGPGGRSETERFWLLKPGELVSFIAADHLFSFLKREAREGRLDFDGMYVSEGGFHAEPTVSPLRASQIKSATQNDGSFDPDDSNMRSNPIPPRDEDFLLDPRPWVDGTSLEHRDDGAGFFHVTTNRHSVFEDGRLRSRQDVKAVGLGGGHTDRGHHVSVVTDWNRAMWLYESMRLLREELEPSGTAVGALKLALEWTGFPDDFAWQNLHDRLDADAEVGDTRTASALKRIFFYILGGDEWDLDHVFGELPLLETGREWLKAVEANADAINDAHPSPAARYSLIQLFEGEVRQFLPDDSQLDEPNACVPTVGFTASFEAFMKIDPKKISITQVAIRRDADPADLIPEECELRFKPEDVQLVAVDCQDRSNVR